MSATLIPANKMTASDAKAFESLLRDIERHFTLCSWLAFVQDGRLAAVFVGRKANDSTDERYYVFRAWSDVDGGGIEYATWHTDKAEAIAARFAAAEGFADVIYDNRKA